MGLPIIGDIIDLVKGVTDKVIVDQNKKQDIMLRLDELAAEADQRSHDELMGQIDVNKVEAASSSVFVAGWRPAIGWICAAGLGWQFVLAPFISMFTQHLPVVQTEALMTLVLSMLGIGAQRTIEKIKGVQTNSIT